MLFGNVCVNGEYESTVRMLLGNNWNLGSNIKGHPNCTYSQPYSMLCGSLLIHERGFSMESFVRSFPFKIRSGFPIV